MSVSQKAAAFSAWKNGFGDGLGNSLPQGNDTNTTKSGSKGSGALSDEEKQARTNAEKNGATAGGVLGATLGVAGAGACDAGTSGICALGNPTIVAGSTALGAAAGYGVVKGAENIVDEGGALLSAAQDKLDRAWSQLTRLLGKAEKDTNPPTAVQYALVATHDGLYPDVRYGLINLKKGDVWKYGTTVDPAGRYPQSTLAVFGLRLNEQAYGNNSQVLVAEKIQLIRYYEVHGVLPPGNKIFK